jgi:hypothetical protein
MRPPTAEKAEVTDSALEIDDVRGRLAAIQPALRRVVELRVFEGWWRYVSRHWNFARNWLEEALAGTPGL